ncbi:amino acid ABC transporter permease [Halocella sp. SP3-1]|nr:amino acid ABC transporter permease [Halocella sp. SP3-1]MTI61713.1 amino acid ABC transporter permease [Bacillota bacterium]
MNNLQLIWSSLPNLLGGALVTIKLTAASLAIGIVLGIPLAFGQIYGNRLIKGLISIYERLFRSIPLLVILFLVFYGFPYAGIRLPDFLAAVLGIGLRSAAYQSQIYRGAIQSVSNTQMKAALSMGMTKLQSFFHVILPQAIRFAIPSFSNEAAIVLKDTSLAYALGVIELLRQGYYVIATSYEPMAIFLAVAAIYLVMTVSLNMVLTRIENKLKIPGIGIEGSSQ